jgi:hypothetical protein
MTDEELVERLLDFDKVTVGDARDAALRIEALINLNEALVELMDDRDAKLAKARSGLIEIFRIVPMHPAGDIARTTLAEIEGEKT